MKTYDFTITSYRGLHAQPTAALCAVASHSDSYITFDYNGKIIDVSDPIQLMSASIPCGAHIILQVSGNDECDTMEKLKEIITLQLL